MPRLLLVDDNESIHKIAETLLHPTDIKLVCAKSAKEALHLVEQGETFDAALLDTAMADMDGWALLDHLRQLPATMHLPIAMMAGVLDTVDPARIAHSPIQGFLKKPVELRDLGDRVHKLINTTPKPFVSTSSGGPGQALSPPDPRARSGEALDSLPPSSGGPGQALSPPDPRARSGEALDSLPPSSGGPGFGPDARATGPSFAASDSGDREGREAEGGRSTQPVPDREEIHTREVALPSDLLILKAEDLLEHPSPAGTRTEDLSPFTEVPHIDETLELEDLDLEGLQEMSALRQTGSHPIPKPAAQKIETAAPYEDSFNGATREFPELEQEELEIQAAPTSTIGALGKPEALVQNSLSDTQSAPLAVEEQKFQAESIRPAILEPEEEAAFKAISSKEPDSVPSLENAPQRIAEPVAMPGATFTAPVKELPAPIVQAPSASADTAASIPATASIQVSAPTQINPQELIKAIIADPELMDQLAKALTSRLAENSMKEIAWEVMPDLLERLQSK